MSEWVENTRPMCGRCGHMAGEIINADEPSRKELEAECANLREQLQAALDALTEQQSITVEWQQAARMDQVLINLKRAEAAEAENTALREALAFYADIENLVPKWIETEERSHPMFIAPYDHDHGKRARAALARPSTAGAPISRADALRISRETLETAERERAEAAALPAEAEAELASIDNAMDSVELPTSDDGCSLTRVGRLLALKDWWKDYQDCTQKAISRAEKAEAENAALRKVHEQIEYLAATARRWSRLTGMIPLKPTTDEQIIDYLRTIINHLGADNVALRKQLQAAEAQREQFKAEGDNLALQVIHLRQALETLSLIDPVDDTPEDVQNIARNALARPSAAGKE